MAAIPTPLDAGLACTARPHEQKHRPNALQNDLLNGHACGDGDAGGSSARPSGMTTWGAFIAHSPTMSIPTSRLAIIGSLGGWRLGITKLRMKELEDEQQCEEERNAKPNGNVEATLFFVQEARFLERVHGGIGGIVVDLDGVADRDPAAIQNATWRTARLKATISLKLVVHSAVIRTVATQHVPGRGLITRSEIAKRNGFVVATRQDEHGGNDENWSHWAEVISMPLALWPMQDLTRTSPGQTRASCACTALARQVQARSGRFRSPSR